MGNYINNGVHTQIHRQIHAYILTYTHTSYTVRYGAIRDTSVEDREQEDNTSATEHS